MTEAGAAMAYLRETSSEMDQTGYSADCVAHACAIAGRLAAAGRSPWIGRIRETREHPRGLFHEPLTPLRLRGRHARTWTTHYVCCADGLAWDPLAGEPLPLEDYTTAVFGRPIRIAEHLPPEATAEHLRRGDLHAAIRRA